MYPFFIGEAAYYERGKDMAFMLARKETLKVQVPAAKDGGARKKSSVTVEVDLGRKRALGGAPVRIYGRKPPLYDYAAAWVYALGAVDDVDGGEDNNVDDYFL